MRFFNVNWLNFNPTQDGLFGADHGWEGGAKRLHTLPKILHS